MESGFRGGGLARGIRRWNETARRGETGAGYGESGSRAARDGGAAYRSRARTSRGDRSPAAVHAAGRRARLGGVSGESARVGQTSAGVLQTLGDSAARGWEGPRVARVLPRSPG